MFPYILIYISLIPFAVSNFRKNFFLVGMYFLFLLIFVGLRYKVGGDWGTYLDIYNAIAQQNSFFSALTFIDPLYAMLNWVAAYYQLGGIYFVNTVCALIFLLGLYKFCYRQKNFVVALFVAVPIFVFMISMGFTRQSAAIGVLFFAFFALTEKKNIHFFVFVFLAANFHISAIIFSIFFVVHLKPRQKVFFLLFFLVLLFIGIVFFRDVFYATFIGSKIETYTSGHINSKGAQLRLGINTLAAVLFFLNMRRFKLRMEKEFVLMWYFSLASIGLFVFSFWFSTIADRLGLYIGTLQILVFANFSWFLSQYRSIVYNFSIFILYLVFLLTWLSQSFFAQNYWIPYGNLLYAL